MRVNSLGPRRKLEKAVAVRDSLLEGFSGNFEAAGKFFPDSPAARNALPRFGLFLARTVAAGPSVLPSGTLLDLLLRDCHSLLDFFLGCNLPVIKLVDRGMQE